MPIFCHIRKKWITSTPEESIRQAIIGKMIRELGFSAESFGVEISLSQLSYIHLEKKQLPKRRADVLYFTKNLQPNPLLLLECKAIPLRAQAIRQVIGYNYYIQAYFIAIANGKEIRLGRKNPGNNEYSFISHLPSCQELLNLILHA